MNCLILMETVGDTEVALVLMFTVHDADLFHSRPTFWPFSTHLEGVTSQVVCFVSIYKPLCVKEEEKQTVLWQLCRLWSIYLRKEGVREREPQGGREVVKSEEFSQSLACWECVISPPVSPAIIFNHVFINACIQTGICSVGVGLKLL